MGRLSEGSRRERSALGVGSGATYGDRVSLEATPLAPCETGASPPPSTLGRPGRSASPWSWRRIVGCRWVPSPTEPEPQAARSATWVTTVGLTVVVVLAASIASSWAWCSSTGIVAVCVGDDMLLVAGDPRRGR